MKAQILNLQLVQNLVTGRLRSPEKPAGSTMLAPIHCAVDGNEARGHKQDGRPRPRLRAENE